MPGSMHTNTSIYIHIILLMLQLVKCNFNFDGSMHIVHIDGERNDNLRFEAFKTYRAV